MREQVDALSFEETRTF